MFQNEDEIRIRLNQILYGSPKIDCEKAYQIWLELSMYSESMGNWHWAHLAEQIADGYKKLQK